MAESHDSDKSTRLYSFRTEPCECFYDKVRNRFVTVVEALSPMIEEIQKQPGNLSGVLEELSEFQTALEEFRDKLHRSCGDKSSLDKWRWSARQSLSRVMKYLVPIFNEL